MTDESGLKAMWDAVPASHGIPDDVMKLARPALAYAMTAASEGDAETAVAIIGKAIMAERERCAEYARKRFCADNLMKRADGGLYEKAQVAVFVSEAISDGILRGDA